MRLANHREIFNNFLYAGNKSAPERACWMWSSATVKSWWQQQIFARFAYGKNVSSCSIQRLHTTITMIKLASPSATQLDLKTSLVSSCTIFLWYFFDMLYWIPPTDQFISIKFCALRVTFQEYLCVVCDNTANIFRVNKSRAMFSKANKKKYKWKQ